MRPDGSALRIADATWPEAYRFVCCANWSPDGMRLAVFVETIDGRAGIAVAAVDLARGVVHDTTVLDVPGGQLQSARWSPDGRFLVYDGVTESSWDLWITSPTGQHSRRLTSLPGNERQAAWAPDGRWLYFHHDSRDVWRIPIDRDGVPAGPPRPRLAIPR